MYTNSPSLLVCSRSFVPILFLWLGLNCLDLLRNHKQVNKSREGIRVAIAAMEDAATNSEWNFMNKLRLLEAEQLTLTKHHWRAINKYDASIESAKKAGFIHEQGLACEKAGFYFKKMDSNNKKALEYSNNEKAMVYFKQARECYKEWGSSVKVDSIQKEIDSLNEREMDSLNVKEGSK